MQGFVLFAVIRHTPKEQLQEFHCLTSGGHEYGLVQKYQFCMLYSLGPSGTQLQ
jgi:hypothetical protein